MRMKHTHLLLLAAQQVVCGKAAGTCCQPYTFRKDHASTGAASLRVGLRVKRQSLILLKISPRCPPVLWLAAAREVNIDRV